MRWMTSHERNQAITTSQPIRPRCHSSQSIITRGKHDTAVPVSRIAAMNLPAYRVEESGAGSGEIWI